jgi:arylsulfatase A-like enzyme
MPAGGTTLAAYPVNSRDAGNTWVGKTYIHNGEDNRPTNIEVDDFFELYKSRAAGDATTDADLKAYATATDSTNEASKTIREEAVRHIESKDSNSAPFFLYVAAMAMRGYGEQSDEQRQKVFDLMESDIDACDIHYPDLQPHSDDVGMKELKRVLELDGQNWNTITNGYYQEFCPVNDVKDEIIDGVSTPVASRRRNRRFTSNSYSTNIDVIVNATIDALYRKNLWDSTLILLTFDNGGWPNDQAFNWPLRGKCPLLSRTSALHTPCCMCLLHL